MFSTLPDEVLAHILGRLSARDVAQMALVSKRFNTLAMSDQIWAQLLKNECWFSYLDAYWHIESWLDTYLSASRDLFLKYQLLKTDTLSGLSLRFGTSRAAIKRINCIMEDHVMAQCQFILIPIVPALVSFILLARGDPSTRLVIMRDEDKALRRKVLVLFAGPLDFASKTNVPDAHALLDQQRELESRRQNRKSTASQFRGLFGGSSEVAALYISLNHGDVRASIQHYRSDESWENELDERDYSRTERVKLMATAKSLAS